MGQMTGPLYSALATLACDRLLESLACADCTINVPRDQRIFKALRTITLRGTSSAPSTHPTSLRVCTG